MILHVMILDKFLPPFIDLIREHFDPKQHKFVFVTSEKYLFGLTVEHDVEFLHTDSDFDSLERYILQSDKVILHGLWRDKVDALLVKHRSVLPKCYWIMWGGDFYFPEQRSENRREVIKNMGFLVTSNFGDIDYARQHYQSTGKHIFCVSYLSNVFYDVYPKENSTSFINVQVGNSAAKNNQHNKVFNTVAQLNNELIKVYCPLSYGCKSNAELVIKEGRNLFGDRFVALTDFMVFSEYATFLSTMDFSILDAERQQGFGNILYLLGMGKKIFLNKKSNLHQYFSELGIKLYDSSEIELIALDVDVKHQNMSLIRKYFTEKRLIETLREWLI